MYDILFKNGMVIDGQGSSAFKADVAVADDLICEIAPSIPVSGAAKVYDISGEYLSPGFIDLHTHSDFPLLRDGRGMSAMYQGVTTQVIGNCGFSPAPLRSPDDLPRNVFCFQGPFTPAWENFSEYIEYFSRLKLGTNVATLVGHGALRSWGMGYGNRSAGQDELNRMQRELEGALEAGAFGLSTGLEYAPGINSDEKELKLLCETVAQKGGLYVTHVRNRDESYRDGFGEALRIADISRVKLQISHGVPKYGAPPEAAEWFRRRLNLSAAENDCAADVIPYEWGPTSLSAVLPKELLASKPEDIAEKLKSTQVRDSVIHQEKHFWLHFRDGLWDQVMLYHSWKFPELIGKNGYEIGDFFNTDPFNGLLTVLQEEGKSMFSVLMMGKIKSRSHLDQLIVDPLVGVISDSMSLATDGPLADMIWSPACYGWVPHFFRNFLGEGKLLSLEKGVEKITSFPARRLGLRDRGIIRKGAKADITVWHPDRIEETVTMQHPGEYARGFRLVMCNGRAIIENAASTGRLPGTLLRKS